MRFGTGGQRSRNLNDNRGGGGRALGIGGSALLLVLSLLFGRDLFTEAGVTPNVASGDVSGQLSPADSAREEPEVLFVSQVMDSVQSSWARILPRLSVPYHDAEVTLYRDAEPTACGTGQSAMGPFYCPRDETVYLDLGFFDELRSRFGAAGDFAQAYVIAHELGHHVQTLLGTDAEVHRAQQRDPGNANEYSVRLELQADCYAGVWGHTAQQQNLLEPGDVQEGLNAAAAVGDDRILSQAGRSVNSESFTHGSSAQRESWFRRGFESGDPAQCDTFAAR